MTTIDRPDIDRETAASDPLEVYLAHDRRPQRAPADADPASPFAGAGADVHDRIRERVRALRPTLEALATEIHGYAEIGFDEHRSAAAIARVLDEHGTPAETGVFGLDTALRASAGPADGPTFAVLAEYDALPEIGHACGHNIIAALAVGAFLAAAPEVGELGARLVLLGTPAEENGGGKAHLIRAGAFEDIDAAGMVHPSGGDSASPVFGGGTTGVRRIRVTYHGRASHAAMSPYLGLNALDAVVTAYQSIAQLRQHILPIDRVHAIITDGGVAANIVPERASAEIFIRSTEIDTLQALTRRVLDIVDAAALATGTRAEVDADYEPPYLPLRNNVSLTKHWARHLGALGRNVPTVPATIRQGGPSTDMGNVTQILPGFHPSLGLGGDGTVLPHNASFAALAVTPSAFDALEDAAVALAGAAVDYLADPELRDAARAEFEASGGVVEWEDE
ncbi:M20 family metallopeptidase [Pseudoclavibacter chungangensis]|uniref:Peptidase M20 domain-containing protein 2 n=1 Tax=Pseudoclavibacter chungangensis TaxID=587635 RepID=A0A7J5C0V4_9MICO|nr:M20 family metallopeptidase [Pseudoclavibacter chungangensis]KAB1662242.1 M20 family metallopeptidase [Pseudoclavibacter chungangensis]NYJ65447.1 amidohydrolase [Pseudoclavibacter chungangensis]